MPPERLNANAAQAAPCALLPGAARRGAALIVTLAVVSLLATLLVSYVSIVSQDRVATHSYVQSLSVEQVGLGGLDRIVSQLQAEIAEPGRSTISGTASNRIYVPLDPIDAAPQRILALATNLASIAKVSTNGVPMYAAPGTAPLAANLASPSPATAPSLNGRSIPLSRWAKPLLVPSTNGFPVPGWVVVTRDGPRAFGGYEAKLASAASGNGSYAVGRYAYVVYDTGGLLDINVAGYPSSAAGSAATKGPLPWADLTQLAPGISQRNVNDLVSWRNATNAANYAAYVATAGTNGFLRVASGDTSFLDRQELIRYAQTQNPAFTNALPFLTVFSREANGPTWAPEADASASYPYKTQALADNGTAAGVVNPSILTARVQHRFTRANGLPAEIGELLVKYRFPLEKLALLEKMRGTGTLSSAEVEEIQKYFGLDVAADVSATSGLYRHWTYPTASQAYAHTAGTILTLNQVAALPRAREPDFFELLQAGILRGSLGMKGGRFDAPPLGTAYPSTFDDPDGKAAYQLVRIGANLADQWDADSYPTQITFNGEDLYGIEDLPYINELFFMIHGSGAKAAGSGSTGTPPFGVYLYFELWNPHQASPVVGSSYPARFRIAPCETGGPVPKDTYSLGFTSTPAATALYWYQDVKGDPTGGTKWTGDSTQVQYFADRGNVTFNASASDFREPSLVYGNAPHNGLPLPLGPWQPSPAPAALTLSQNLIFPPAARVASTPVGSGVTWGSVVGGTWSLTLSINVTMRIQYQDAAGGWHTYGTFEGMDTPAVNSGFGLRFGIYPWLPPNTGADSVNSDFTFPKSDPRTFRFGPGFSYVFPSPNTNPIMPPYPTANVSLNPSRLVVDSPVTQGSPFRNGFNGKTTPPTPYRMDLWSVNDPAATIFGWSNTITPWYKDPDGVQRYGDARFAYPNASPFYTGAAAARPVVLNRPFQSVGEIGHAYRDLPWRTLDLFSANSADAALLDLFSIGSATVAAGRVHPGTPWAPVLKALLSGAAKNTSGNTTLAANEADKLAKGLVTTPALTPYLNRADLVTATATNTAVTDALAAVFTSGAKAEREAVVRALADAANTRTWNFLVDVVAQSGHYPAAARTLDDFLVTGERRYWLHVAIDRYTGQIVDKHLEPVSE